MGLNEQLARDGYITTTVDAAMDWAKSNSMNIIDKTIAWGQKNSMWPMPLGISCCGIEMMAFASSRFDAARFGSEKMGFTPRQSDLLIVAGTVTYKMSWIVRKIYDQMPDPKWVIAMGACSSSGGMFRSYSVVQGVDQFIPVDVYVSGCPPRPESLLKALVTQQEKTLRTSPTLLDFGKKEEVEA